MSEELKKYEMINTIKVREINKINVIEDMETGNDIAMGYILYEVTYPDGDIEVYNERRFKKRFVRVK